MDKQAIEQAIRDRVQAGRPPDYSAWAIGLTHDPDERKQWYETKGKSTKYWKQWIADSLFDAQGIESFFINQKNMHGGNGGDLSVRKTVYVYIF